MTEDQFRSTFIALTGNQNGHFPWQWALYQKFAMGEVPPSCNLPTGLGKTTVIALWLIALANHPDRLPRRLVYVVNRRTVVDQTTTEVEKLRDNLRAAGLSEPLEQLCAILLEKDEPPLAISTLRGQFADNREWSADPARPAVIAGTVDMIGSRLLFSGYRVGFKGKPLQAGFLGQDVLLVHDEAHLEPAFQELIETIQQEQCKREWIGPIPPVPCCHRHLQIMTLTATSRSEDSIRNNDFELTDAERSAPQEIPDPPTEPLHVVWRRLKAQKHLCLNAVEDEIQVPGRIGAIAAGYKDANAAVLVFARKLDAVSTIEKELDKTGREVVTLTGTMRGKERDELLHKPEFRRFFKGAEPGETVYLVCTSAGEVGIDISADHMVCDLSTFDSMAQRLGRVHRYGEPIACVARIDVVHPTSFGKIDKKTGELKADDIDKRRSKTLELLRKLPDTDRRSEAGSPIYDASPKNLTELREYSDLPCKIEDAFAPPPTILPVTDVLLDSWALTTIREELPGRPPVEPYLHGIPEQELPETYVAWREEVGLLYNAGFSDKQLGEFFADYPLKPHELLRDRSDRVFKHLTSLTQEHGEQTVWLVDDYGEVETVRLRELVEKRERINWMTVVLPPSVGGLTPQGTLGYGAPAEQLDVADQWYQHGQQRRMRIWDGEDEPEGMRLVRTIDINPDADEKPEDETAARRYWHWYVRPLSADDDGSKTSTIAVTWDDHTRDVEQAAKQLADKLLANHSDLHAALILAARCHDRGKLRDVWQRGIGNDHYPERRFAKSGLLPDGSRLRPRQLNDAYRHEFGSLLDVSDESEFQQLNNDMKDLVLHLIAAHHGRGRPHFPPDEAFDPDPKGKDAARIAAEVPRRFARLQRKYGRWGLAYLESLLRAADYAASAGLL
ncbi:MAG TPA: type I-U CRISPR-associated helicase/endonuclease Cas3 [Gemmataceae bacterium]